MICAKFFSALILISFLSTAGISKLAQASSENEQAEYRNWLTCASSLAEATESKTFRRFKVDGGTERDVLVSIGNAKQGKAVIAFSKMGATHYPVKMFHPELLLKATSEGAQVPVLVSLNPLSDEVISIYDVTPETLKIRKETLSGYKIPEGATPLSPGKASQALRENVMELVDDVPDSLKFLTKEAGTSPVLAIRNVLTHTSEERAQTGETENKASIAAKGTLSAFSSCRKLKDPKLDKALGTLMAGLGVSVNDPRINNFDQDRKQEEGSFDNSALGSFTVIAR
jgi:hypothetical protein